MGNSFLQFRIVRFHNKYGLFYDIEYLHHYGPFKLFSKWKPINRESQKIFGEIKIYTWPDNTYGFATKEIAESAIQKLNYAKISILHSLSDSRVRVDYLYLQSISYIGYNLQGIEAATATKNIRVK